MKRNAIITLALICLLAFTAYKAKEGEYAKGYNDGALRIISNLVSSENISYTSLDGMEYEIQLAADEPQWFQHEQEPMCKICHKYSIDYSEGGK